MPQERWRAVVQILKALVEDYAYSPQANCRKGGLLALAAAAVALADRKGVRSISHATTLYPGQDPMFQYCICVGHVISSLEKSIWMS